MPLILQFEGGYNFRDLGEIPTVTGQSTKKGVFLRSGGLDKLTTAGQEALINHGLQTVIDLRSEWECKNYPNVFAKSRQLQYLNLPMMKDELSNHPDYKAKTKNYNNLGDLYRVYLASCEKSIGTIISTIAENEGQTLFHCYAGKDRTGIVAMLLLSIVGVADELIASDYAETNVHIKHLQEEWRAAAIKEGRDLAKLERDKGAAPETMHTSLAFLRQQYGSVAEYLQVCGVSESQIAKIQMRFV